MAKGNRLGVLRGKIGNEVLYKITNSNNKVTQGSRPYVANVANPKTMAQAVQRMKLAPAKNFYQAFGQEILNHSFQGIKYGGRSHAKFMQLVMQNKAGNYPFVPKDTTELIPGRFPVSRGSLSPIEVQGIIYNENIPGVEINLGYEFFYDDAAEKWNIWVDRSIESGAYSFKYGDQITLVAIMQAESGVFYARVARIVLEHIEDDDKMALDYMQEQGLNLSETTLAFIDNGSVSTTPIAAAAVIVSRPQVSKTSGQVTWLRSDADMFVPEEILNQYNSQAAFEIALQSYLPSAVNVESDWYLNGGSALGTEGGYPVAPGLTSKITTYLCPLMTTRFGGRFIARSINAQTGSAKAIAVINRGAESTSFTLYGLTANGAEQGLNSTTLFAVTSEPVEITNSEPEVQMLLDWLGDTETPLQAIAEQAALGNTYTLNA